MIQATTIQARPRAVTYLRCSSDKQKELGTSISAQRKMCRDYCGRLQYDIVREYVDDGISGTSTERNALRSMLNDARAKQFDVIVLYDTSRFDRSKEGEMELHRVRQLGIKVDYVVLPMQYDQDGDLTPESALTESQIKSLDRYFSLKLGRDVLRGNKEVTSKGFRVGGSPPYGYRRKIVQDGSAQRSTIEPDPVMAPIVREMFELKLSGLGDRKIVAHLNEKKIAAPRRGTGGWMSSTVRAILGNRAYIGEMVYNKRKWRRDSQSQKRRPTPKSQSEWIVREGTHEGLISVDVFDRAQELRTPHAPRAKKQEDRHVYLLSGLVVCDQCGVMMKSLKAVNGKRRSYYFYRCGVCKRNVPAFVIEMAVIHELRTQLLSDEGIARAWVALSKPGEEPKVKETKHLIAELERKAANVVKAVEDGNVSFAPRHAELLQEIERAQRRLRSLQSMTRAMLTRAELSEGLLAIGARLSLDDNLGQNDPPVWLDEAHREELKATLRCLVREVGVKERDMRIACALTAIPSLSKEHCGGWI